jgi:hypothetical protein
VHEELPLADVDLFRADALRVMPELDAITMATPPEAMAQSIRYAIPATWPAGDYVLWIEVNTEGDYNADWQLPTPSNPAEGGEAYWDYWALRYGYPYRGQPSVVWRVPFTIVSMRAAPPPPYWMVLRPISLAAVTTLVWSTRLKPAATARSRTAWRSRTTSSPLLNATSSVRSTRMPAASGTRRLSRFFPAAAPCPSRR